LRELGADEGEEVIGAEVRFAQLREVFLHVGHRVRPLGLAAGAQDAVIDAARLRTLVRPLDRAAAVAREAVEPARRCVREALAEWGVSEREELSYDIQLVLSELLSNAIVHGSGPLTVTVQRDNGLFIVEGFDMHRDMRVESVSGPDDESKRGLAVVNSVAYSHGCERCPRGKRCWAVLRRP